MTKEEILSRLLSNISDEYDKSVGSFFYDVEKPVSDELETVYSQVEDILKNGFAKTAEGKYLDNKVAEQGLIRKPATAATVMVKISGAQGSEISKGDKVASDELVFTVTENAVIDVDGFVYVTASCDTPGKIGNIPVGAINRFPVTLPGLVTVTNEEAATGGYDEETDDELRERYFEKVSLPATSGSKHHYEAWAKEVSGVGDAKCIPLWNGAGTVKVIIINADKGVASSELIAEVTAHIEENRPIGASVTVESAEPLIIDISVSLVLGNGLTEEVAIGRITEKVTDFLQNNAFSATYISFAQIGSCILNCEGIMDYTDLTINGGTENVTVSETSVPVLGVITIV
ncbi:MAG: baseplate J/gp47 family protein [Firmicutes bacterium]|nr:baseplate J/gp47 family protein [Bacillota bacterium]